MVAAAILVALPVSTFAPFPVMVPALVTILMVVSVVVAPGVRIIPQRSCRQRLRGRIGGTGDTAVELDARLGQRGGTRLRPYWTCRAAALEVTVSPEASVTMQRNSMPLRPVVTPMLMVAVLYPVVVVLYHLPSFRDLYCH